MRLRLLPLLLLAAALAVPASAGAAKPVPCWKLVLQDSFTGRFDTIYPHSCYRQAIARIPTQLLLYGDTRDEIEHAAAAALNHRTYSVNVPGGTGTSAASSTSGGSHGVPTAIVVLGGVAVALLLVGGAGEAWRRTRRDR